MSRIRFRGRNVMSLCLAFMSIGMIVTARQWTFRAALFPMIMGSCALLLSVIEIIMTLLEREGTGSEKQPDAMDYKLAEQVDAALTNRRTAMAFRWIIGFFLLIVLFGLNLGIVLFVFSYIKISGKETWPVAIIVTAGSWLLFWGLFVWLLNTPMPEGLILRALD